MLVSIIVPAYNSEHFIHRCIESLISQTYTNIEIVVIDDCSTDNTIEILNQYLKLDKRIKLERFKIHQGNGKGRNLGIKKASGEYVMFVDSDDEIEKNTVQSLVDAIHKKPCNVAVLGYYETSIKGNGSTIIRKVSIPTITGKESQSELFTYYLLLGKSIHPQSWIYFCNRQYLLNNCICFDESGRKFEDVIFSAKLIYYADSIVPVKIPLYYYTFRKGSITSERGANNVKDRIEAYLSVKKFLIDKGRLLEFRDAYIYCFVKTCFLMAFMDFIRMKYRDKELYIYFQSLINEPIIRNFDIRHLNIPDPDGDKILLRQLTTTNAMAHMISRHFVFFEWLYRSAFKLKRLLHG